jgi:hypothetical protein
MDEFSGLRINRYSTCVRANVQCGMVGGDLRHREAKQQSQAPEAHCTRKSPLPLLPSGPGGVGGNALRGTDA